jgi:hypothetical protein
MLYWAISKNADIYPLVPGFTALRVAKTRGARTIAPLRVYFVIVDLNQVELKYIQSLEDGQ